MVDTWKLRVSVEEGITPELGRHRCEAEARFGDVEAPVRDFNSEHTATDSASGRGTGNKHAASLTCT